MTEGINRFKIKKGNIEIEYEGPIDDFKETYQKAFDHIMNVTTETEDGIEELGEKPEGKSKKGGVRSPIISRAVDGLMSGTYFDTYHNKEEVADELKRLGTPGVSPKNVGFALDRRLKRDLERIKDSGKWVYKKKSV